MNPFYSDTMEYFLISDLDDTLIGKEEATIKFNSVINKNRDKFKLAYSSGRFKESMIEVIQENGLIYPDIIVSNVGTEIYHGPLWDIDEEWENIISGEWDKEKITSLIEDLPIQPQPYDKKYTASYNVEDESVVEEIEKRLHNLPVRIIHTKKEKLDIIPESAGKGNSALYLGKSKSGEIICCGDSENDLSMLKKCDFGILVGNSQKRVREELSGVSHVYLADSEYADGVIEGLQYYKLIE